MASFEQYRAAEIIEFETASNAVQQPDPALRAMRAADKEFAYQLETDKHLRTVLGRYLQRQIKHEEDPCTNTILLTVNRALRNRARFSLYQAEILLFTPTNFKTEKEKERVTQAISDDLSWILGFLEAFLVDYEGLGYFVDRIRLVLKHCQGGEQVPSSVQTLLEAAKMVLVEGEQTKQK